jgi:hypothetical protein
MPGNDKYGLVIFNHGSCRLIEIVEGGWSHPVDETTVRIFPTGWGVAGMDFHDVNQEDYRLHLLSGDGEDVWTSLPTLKAPFERRIPVDPQRISCRNMEEASPEMSKSFIAALCAEIVRKGRLEAEIEMKRREKGEWPILLCRHAVSDKETIPIMTQLVEDLASHMAFISGQDVDLRLELLPPSQTEGNMSVYISEGGNVLNADFRDFLSKLFEDACGNLFPDGWTEIVGPERPSKRLAFSVAAKIRSTGRKELSSHQRLALISRFGMGPKKEQEQCPAR